MLVRAACADACLANKTRRSTKCCEQCVARTCSKLVHYKTRSLALMSIPKVAIWAGTSPPTSTQPLAPRSCPRRPRGRCRRAGAPGRRRPPQGGLRAQSARRAAPPWQARRCPAAEWAKAACSTRRARGTVVAAAPGTGPRKAPATGARAATAKAVAGVRRGARVRPSHRGDGKTRGRALEPSHCWSAGSRNACPL